MCIRDRCERGCCANKEDLDCITKEFEMEEALRWDLPELREAKGNFTPANLRGKKIAIVQMGEKVNRGKIKIGWLFCRVRRTVMLSR